MQKRKVIVVWNDFYHRKEVLAPAVDAVFDPAEWEVVRTENARDAVGADADLLILFAIGRPDGVPDLTLAEQEQVVHQVEEGMGILFFHAGMVLTGTNSPYLTKLNSGSFISHPARKGNLYHAEQCQVTVTPLPGVPNPITEGVEPFTELDEHYFVKMDVGATQLLACATSEHGTTPAVWAHPYGKGRVTAITEGHTVNTMENPNMRRLLQNAANWAVRGSELPE